MRADLATRTQAEAELSIDVAGAFGGAACTNPGAGLVVGR